MHHIYTVYYMAQSSVCPSDISQNGGMDQAIVAFILDRVIRELR